MAAQLQASTSPVLTDSKLGFFETLPRELRDAVYDLLYQEVTADVEGLEFHTRIVIVELRLVSRQFRLEYDERSVSDEHNNHLTITDREAFDLSAREPAGPEVVAMRCPSFATRTTSLTLNLIACLGGHEGENRCDADTEVEWHVTWIKSLLQSLPHLRKICVRLDLVSTFCISTVLKQAKLFTALPNSVDLEVMGLPSLDSMGSADDSILLATWTKQHRLQEDHEAIELCRENPRICGGGA